MTTEERMMIMGMCLQGILANPNYEPCPRRFFKDDGPEEKATVRIDHEKQAQQLADNIALAHRYAQALAPLPETTTAEKVADLTRTAYEVLRAAEVLGSGFWPPFDEARFGAGGEEAETTLMGVFERVRQAYGDPAWGVGDMFFNAQDRIIAAVVAASRPQAGGWSLTVPQQPTAEQERFYNDH